MTIRVDTDGPSGVRPVAAARGSSPAAVDPHAALPSADRVELSTDVPQEAQDAVDFAFQQAGRLAAQNRELHFVKDERSGDVVVQIRDLQGNLIRTVPNSEVFEVANGHLPV